ncbi:MAG: methylmalonyl-CoA mutase family protein [Bacteroidales bacterium]|nr:methylmalonyl-CoA mutase family protein [Bacteroidales bacterium]
MQSKLLFTDDFKPTETAEWEQQIIKELKDADYEKVIWKTIEGFKVQPFYRLENVINLKHYSSDNLTLLRTSKIHNNKWEINEFILLHDLNENNKEIQKATLNEITNINLFFYNNVQDTFRSYRDIQKLFKNIDLDSITLTFNLSFKTHSILPFFEEFLNKNKINKININFDYSPIDELIFNGTFAVPEEHLYDHFLTLFKNISNTFPSSRFIGINTYKLNDCGITSTQEVAFALAIAVEYLHNLSEKGLKTSEIIERIIFNFGINSNFFFEIAKLRAFRLLWETILNSYNLKVDKCLPYIHSINTIWNKTILDPYVNILRSTIEAIAAIFGGTNSLTIRPFDLLYKKPDEFSMQVARNIQLILKEEAKFDKIIDPLGGSYYLETLTQNIANNAWNLFIEIENNGGFVEAFKKGFIQNIIENTQQERLKNLYNRYEILVGVNQYPNLLENILNNFDDVHYKKMNSNNEFKQNYNYQPVKMIRASQEFELIRLQTYKLPSIPKVYLLKYGNITMRNARANFSSNFFGCAGYKIIEGTPFDDLLESINEAKSSNADIVVICSSDEEYPKIVPEIVKELKNLFILVLAGYPKDYIEKFKEMGLINFIHIKSNIVESLKYYNNLLSEKLNYN